MDLDELPSSVLPDLDENLELFPGVAQSDSLDLLPSIDSEPPSISQTSEAAPIPAPVTEPSLPASTPAPPTKAPPKRAPTKKKTTALKKPTATSAPVKKGRVTISEMPVIKAGPRKPKTKPAGAVNGISPGIGRSSGAVSTGNDSDDPGTYCLCKGQDDHRWMICCEKCEDWFHGECINMDKETGENLIEMFICPKCTDGQTLMTRYKKMCSLSGCRKAARSYLSVPGKDRGEEPPENNSVFCSDDHCQQWWEQVIVRLPPTSAIPPSIVGRLSREDLLGVIASDLSYVDEATDTYKIARVPFANIKLNSSDPEAYLSSEQKDLLAQSVLDRAALAEESATYEKMLVLLDRTIYRHQAAVAAGYIANDICGYDCRLDTLTAEAAFNVFLATPEGTIAMSGESLAAPLKDLERARSVKDEEERNRQLALAGMCDRKRCKVHAGWAVMFGKMLRAHVQQLADQAQNLVNEEGMIREAAVERAKRRLAEENRVEMVEDITVKMEEDVKMGSMEL